MKLARVDVKRIDDSVSEVSYQQVIGEGAESGRRNCDSPRRIELTTRDQPLLQNAVHIENVHVTVTQPGDIDCLGGVLSCIHYIELATQRPDIERRESARQIRVVESTGNSGAGPPAVIHFDCAGKEVRDVERRT